MAASGEGSAVQMRNEKFPGGVTPLPCFPALSWEVMDGT